MSEEAQIYLDDATAFQQPELQKVKNIMQVYELSKKSYFYIG